MEKQWQQEENATQMNIPYKAGKGPLQPPNTRRDREYTHARHRRRVQKLGSHTHTQGSVTEVGNKATAGEGTACMYKYNNVMAVGKNVILPGNSKAEEGVGGRVILLYIMSMSCVTSQMRRHNGTSRKHNGKC